MSALLTGALVTGEIPPIPGTSYLNAAATGPLPVRTLAAVAAFNDQRATPWALTLEEQFGALSRSRELCARLINASPDEIALTPNTSTGLHVAARCLPVAAGKIVLGHDAEFPANVYPWMSLERTRGTPYERIPLRGGLPDHDALVARVARGDVGIVALSWVSFVSGDRADLARIGGACRRHGAWLVVDAIQGVGAVRLDVTQCHVDILSCGAQKWLCSPWGSAFTYVRRELVDRLDPHSGGWLAIRGSEDFERMLDYDLTYWDGARKFEIATLPYQDFVGMNASLELLFELGLDAVEQHVRAITTRLVDGISAIRGLTLLTPCEPGRRAGIVSCTAAHAGALARRLADAGVVVSLRAGGILRF
jgi:selenocysteine lyase/cysteine desulfurase